MISLSGSYTVSKEVIIYSCRERASINQTVRVSFLAIRIRKERDKYLNDRLFRSISLEIFKQLAIECHIGTGPHNFRDKRSNSCQSTNEL